MLLPVRRRLLLHGLLAGASSLAGCGEASGAPLRVGAQPWPGYELMYLARARQYFDPDRVRLVEMPSASASLRALATGALDGAALTLDEVLTARSHGLPMVVVAVLDVSMGADAVMGRRSLSTPGDLAGWRIGVEPSATGAVMLDALLSRSGLALRAVQVVPLTVDEHVRAYLEGKVDAIVTYEPVKSQLKALGARALFSSAEVPGRIVDTLAMHRDRLTPHLRAAGELVGSHFRALGDWAQAPAACAQTMAPRLKLAASDVQAAFAELDLPDLAANRAWLRPDQPSLGLAAARLAGVMLRAGLLAQPAELDDLTDDRFLPSR